MKPIPLSSFVDMKGQDEAAKSLGSSQTAICKALKSGRLILVSEDTPGKFTAMELRGFPSSGPSQRLCPDLEEIVKKIGLLGQSTAVAGNSSSSGVA